MGSWLDRRRAANRTSGLLGRTSSRQKHPRQSEEESLTANQSSHGKVFARMGRNVVWLLAGRGFAGLASIAYLALAARALGPPGFGTFSLIVAYGSSIASLAEFPSWKAVLRYGAAHLAEQRPVQLANLLGLTATLDCGGALVGALLAYLGAGLAGPTLGWTIAQQHSAALFGAALLLSTGGTATGILRLYNRFDLLSYTEAIGPAFRLVGALLVWALNWHIGALLTWWAIAAFVEEAAGWVAALWIREARLKFGVGPFASAIKENPRVLRFIVHNSCSGSLSLVWNQGGILAVGAYGGPAAAGGYRAACKLAGAMAKPAEILTRVLYPELTRLAASNDRNTLARVALRTSSIAVLSALALVLLAWLGGAFALQILSGNTAVFARPYLLLLAIAAGIDLCGLALEPILNAHGYSGRILLARSFGAIAFLSTLALLLPRFGTVSAAIATIATSVVLRGTLALAALKIVYAKKREDRRSDQVGQVQGSA